MSKRAGGRAPDLTCVNCASVKIRGRRGPQPLCQIRRAPRALARVKTSSKPRPPAGASIRPFGRISPPLPLLGTTSTRAGRSRDGRLGLAVSTDDHGAEPLPQHRLERARLWDDPWVKSRSAFGPPGLVSNHVSISAPARGPSPCQTGCVKTERRSGPDPQAMTSTPPK